MVLVAVCLLSVVCHLLSVQSVVVMVETATRENQERAEAEKARIRREKRTNKR